VTRCLVKKSEEWAWGSFRHDAGGKVEVVEIEPRWTGADTRAVWDFSCAEGATVRRKEGPYRWLTVASPEEPDGTELQLALNNNPAAKAYQQAIFQQSQPAIMFFTDDIKGDYDRIKARGPEFTMPPTAVTGSTIAMLKDTCGNLIQLTQLARD
jgi:hypothetical protein